MFKTLCLIAAWLLLISVTPLHAQDSAESSQALIGSNRDANNPEANATVWIGGCTGTLIKPDMIVTAGHCTNRIGPASNYLDNVWYPVGNLENTRWADIRFGVDKDNPIVTVTATHFAVYSPADIALFLLAQRIPREVAAPASVLLNADGTDWTHQSFRQAGWGNTVALTGSSTPRFRRTGNATFNSYPCDGAKFCVSGATAGPGDSGGPLYWTDENGRTWIIGEAQGNFGVGARYIPLFRDGVNDFVRFNLSRSRCSLIEYSRRILDRGFVRLVSWYSDGRGDNLTTTEAVWQGCDATDRRSPDYSFVRVEGKIFHPQAAQPAGTVPLYRWYSSPRGDNWTTTQHAAEGRRGEDLTPNYKRPTLMGYVYPPDFSPVRPDMVPLFSWYSSGRQDNWLTTAHDAEGAARQGLMPGYGFVRLEGYALRD